MRAVAAALTTLALLAVPARASAEWQIKPFLGVSFGAESSFVLNGDVGGSKLAVGASAVLIGEVVGVELDVGHTPGFFGNPIALGQPLVLKSGVTTVTGNVVVAVPRHLTKYTLRPYLVGGAGMMHVDFEDPLSVFSGNNLATMDVGGGVTGFVTRRVGVSWDVRYFRSVNGQVGGNSLSPEQVSFWRANMAFAIRF